MKLNFKKKSIVLIASAVLFSPIVSDLSNTTNNQTNSHSSNIAHAAKIKYKLASVKTRTVSIQEQKDNAKGQFIGKTLAELAVGGAGIQGAKTAMSVLGFANGWHAIQSPKKYSTLTAKKYHYVPKKKTKNTGKIMSGYNEGYYVIKLYNKKTGKKVSSKKIYIQRA
ncbi:hypothetical protein BU069_12800 [Staphylococcus succinus]|nr:hypothetical protein BU069_12800 [Staphylococcus succinus]